MAFYDADALLSRLCSLDPTTGLRFKEALAEAQASRCLRASVSGVAPNDMAGLVLTSDVSLLSGEALLFSGS